MAKNIKYKVHYKNDKLDKVADSMYDNIDRFEEALIMAHEHVDDLNAVRGSGWRIIGIYEILYNYEKYLASVH